MIKYREEWNTSPVQIAWIREKNGTVWRHMIFTRPSPCITQHSITRLSQTPSPLWSVDIHRFAWFWPIFSNPNLTLYLTLEILTLTPNGEGYNVRGGILSLGGYCPCGGSKICSRGDIVRSGDRCHALYWTVVRGDNLSDQHIVRGDIVLW